MTEEKARMLYERDLAAIECDIAKDPSLADMRREWKRQARQKYESRLAAAKKKALPPEQERMLNHNERVIECEMYKIGESKSRGEKTDHDLYIYDEEATERQRKLKKFLRKGGTPIYNTSTEMWEIPQEEHK